MNKVYRFIITIFALVGILFIFEKNIGKKNIKSTNMDLYLYNWGDYIDPEIIKDFEKETGYNVIYETFDSNEAMMAKIEQGKTQYDLTFPSEYTVEMMRDKGLLKKLDHKKIKGLENIDPRFLNLDYDPNNEYSIPYFWGSLGIIYNRQKYKAEDFDSWKNLWDEKFKGEILSFDGARETLGIGLLAQGYSLNTTDEKVLIQTQKYLAGFMNNVKAILADEIKMYLAQGEANVGISFSGEAAMAKEENEDLDYVIPKDGSNIWFDTVVIPKTSKNTEGAYAFINYLLRPEVASKNTEYVCYSTPNTKAKDYLSEEMINDKTLYPDDQYIDHLEVFKDLGKEKTILYNDLFLDLKISPNLDEK